ncbi:SWI/SNF and RSC complex subunit Ssr3 [Elasticomyces elasticus]|nr:SWI/SNF and RSC complex subunit Ssr3 [Elasticomyces elasticus]
MVPPPSSHAHAVPHNVAVSAAQQAEENRRRDMQRRLSRKPTDRNIPDELAEVVIGDGVQRYKSLRDVERRLDAAMTRKRLDVQDNLARNVNKEGTLRIWISNTADGQPWQLLEDGGASEDGTFDLGENSQAIFRVKIEGRLLQDPEEDEETAQNSDDLETNGQEVRETTVKSAPPFQRTRFSHFFKSITINFDRPAALQPDGYTSIEWKKPTTPINSSQQTNDAEANFDCLEFERKADENINVTINLVRDDMPERFRLSPQLRDILDIEEDDRAGVIMGLWDYVRVNNLQEDNEVRRIRCDEPLKALFGQNQDTVFFPVLPDMIVHHLQPIPPVSLPYTIRVDKAYISPPIDSNTPPTAYTIYDIPVSLPSPLRQKMQLISSSPTHLANLQQIVQLDDALALTVQKINHTNAKRKFYDSLSRDPARFVKRWISSQQRDLEVILAEATRGGGEDGSGEEFRRGGPDGVWGTSLARESVGLWLARAKAH